MVTPPGWPRELRLRIGAFGSDSEGVIMRSRLILAAAATLALAACGESASTAPRSPSPGARAADVVECRSGYHIATRADGTEYCAPDEAFMAATAQTSSGS